MHPELQRLRVLTETLEDARKEFASFLLSDEAEKAFEFLFPRNRILALLRDVTTRKARSDGWTSLDIAVNFIKEQAPEELSLLKTRYGCKTLKSFMLLTELFDFYDEVTPKGGTRVLYRITSN